MGSSAPVTVAIPVRDGGALLAEVLDAVRGQILERPVELIVADSGSTDGSRERCEAVGARVLAVAPGEFSHGGTRNRLMAEAAGSHVALLTQDAVPASPGWLAALLAGFDLAEDVGLVFGPYLPRADASPMVARELTEFFAGLAPDGRPRLDRAASGETVTGPGPRSFFSDANGAVARRAWEAVPFADVPYAEDQRLALDMLEAGWAKAFVPQAAVTHSHDYAPWEWFQRWFDEFRGLREVHGWVEPADPRRILGKARGGVGADLRWLRARGTSGPALTAGAGRSVRHHLTRAAAAQLGGRADRLPPGLRRRLSLEGRASFRAPS